MKSIIARLIPLLAVLFLSVAAPACDGTCSSAGTCRTIRINHPTVSQGAGVLVDGGKAGVHCALQAVNTSTHAVAHFPGTLVKKATAKSTDLREVVVDAVYQTQVTFAKFSAEVTSLSVTLFRNVFSMFWALLLDLWR
jgi:hypothetical protein